MSEPINIAGKRFYDTPGGLYPSVTTVIQGVRDSVFTGNKYTERGQNVHKMLECFLRGHPISTQNLSQEELLSFARILHYIDNDVLEHIDVLGIEQFIYSTIHKYAGRIDLVAMYKDVISIIDFKTRTELPRTPGQLNNYWLQLEAYRQAWNIMNPGLYAHNLIVIIGAINDFGAVYIATEKEKTDAWTKFQEKLKTFYVYLESTMIRDEIADSPAAIKSSIVDHDRSDDLVKA